ncbi:hypothetical protein Poli38472_011436 [Pythium oligandrum]|uniref:BZIP domain-containing protein n=1 Tax=Pythium oligandrum TaxID=41045 RepID=A0A8K1CKT4_PYTOL|nr:hypothetical protein Poli38472_011436 [Pythium oligandrum]|eukprot:TMW64556.1 hypothetical protein Poli38472_011436 [Pythium oligandrum]
MPLGGNPSMDLGWSVSAHDLAVSYLADPMDAFTVKTSDLDLDLNLNVNTNTNSDNEEEEDDEEDDDNESTTSTAADSDSNSPSMDTKFLPLLQSFTKDNLDLAAAVGTSHTTRPQRRKRARMSAEERKIRHREVQRQFMKRKRARIAELRKIIAVVEKQHRLAIVMQECQQLQQDNERMRMQMNDRSEVKSSFDFDAMPFSVPVDSEQPSSPMGECDELMFDELPWDEILDAVSDEELASVDTSA